MKPASLRVPLSLLLLKSEFGVPSSWAYSRWQATREAAGEIYQSQKFGDITFVNDLERPVFEKFVFLAQREIVVAQTTGSWRCVNVGVRFDDFRGFAVQCGWRFGCEARKVRARSRIVVVCLPDVLTPGSARVSRVGFGVSPKRTSPEISIASENMHETKKSAIARTRIANTRDACATRNQFAASIILIPRRFVANSRLRIRD